MGEGPEKIEFQKWSYKSHEEHLSHYSAGGAQSNQAQTWYDPHTVDAWRHRRMHQLLDPILAMYPQATWVTIGDGRIGSDAHYIQTKGIKVLATDIADTLLKEAKAVGYIEAYQKENAESLSFNDNSFDFALCKESLHHFPRPFTAIYEMLRVTKIGVALMEPTDELIESGVLQPLFRKLKILIKKLLKKPYVKYVFEDVGNFVYPFSKRELEKLALGLNLKTIVFNGINDIYWEKVECEPADPDNKVFKKINRAIALNNVLSRLNLTPYNLLFALILKNKIAQNFEDKLTAQGYEVINLPENPYYKE